VLKFGVDIDCGVGLFSCRKKEKKVEKNLYNLILKKSKKVY
jgi:hypothetical protein